jgi:hypothetical protein
MEADGPTLVRALAPAVLVDTTLIGVMIVLPLRG